MGAALGLGALGHSPSTRGNTMGDRETSFIAVQVRNQANGSSPGKVTCPLPKQVRGRCLGPTHLGFSLGLDPPVLRALGHVSLRLAEPQFSSFVKWVKSFLREPGLWRGLNEAIWGVKVPRRCSVDISYLLCLP